jgi:salicylate hydroxylase
VTAAWPSTNVTLIGDAIHTMSPVRGSGANIALMDAGVLTANLRRADMLDSVRAYEAELRSYAFTAMTDSLAAVREGNGVTGKIRTALNALHRG